MPRYLVQVNYGDESDPGSSALSDRLDAIAPIAASLHGSVERGWLTLGDYDIVAVFDVPAGTTGHAVADAFAATNMVQAVETTRIFSYEEGLALSQCVHGYPSVAGDCEH